MITPLRTIELAGRRVLRIGAYLHDDGSSDDPEPRIVLALGWEGQPGLDGGPVITFPTATVPVLSAALAELAEGL